jgi:RES domain-containing protein
MRAWRLTRAVYAPDPLSGRGAAIAGNRWNSPGTRVAYTSTSRALAALEMLVHVTRETVPPDIVFVPVDVPDQLVREASGLPGDWADLPYGSNARRFGDRWAGEGRSLGLLVPSVVVPEMMPLKPLERWARLGRGTSRDGDNRRQSLSTNTASQSPFRLQLGP